MGIFPSRPMTGRYVRCIEWTTRRVLSGPCAVYWVGRSDSITPTFSPQSVPGYTSTRPSSRTRTTTRIKSRTRTSSHTHIHVRSFMPPNKYSHTHRNITHSMQTQPGFTHTFHLTHKRVQLHTETSPWQLPGKTHCSQPLGRRTPPSVTSRQRLFSQTRIMLSICHHPDNHMWQFLTPPRKRKATIFCKKKLKLWMSHLISWSMPAGAAPVKIALGIIFSVELCHITTPSMVIP